MLRIKLYRVCNERVRYYDMLLYKTLFGDFCIERIYGSLKNKRPTGLKKEFFASISDAKARYFSIMKAKKSKGYSQQNI